MLNDLGRGGIYGEEAFLGGNLAVTARARRQMTLDRRGTVAPVRMKRAKSIKANCGVYLG